VQAAYAAYLDAWIDVANLPGTSERSVSQEAAAQEVEYRLYEADKAHYEAWHAANREVHPELYRDDRRVMTTADWQATYPLLNMDREAEAE
jgi:alanine dehydrogenase